MFCPTGGPGWRATMFNCVVAPRPIAWVSSTSAQGIDNLAPFSYFNGVSATPPMVMFACNAPDDRHEKDTLANVRATGEYCVNIVGWELRERMNASSATVAAEVDEFQLAGLAKAPCELVRVPRVLEAPASLECRLHTIVDIPPRGPGERASAVVIGRVLALHAQDRFIDGDGRFDPVAAQLMTRLGGFRYSRLTESFEMPRPDGRPLRH
ncbi:MAG TPA: flavin reductase family protein [Ramlibacter sp.]|nr:flavin reductase family protein [Ramlibacter sp.]